ncbi:hypothetical protein CJ030_MR5G010119 [Morella rubra]|uniref:Uncharacterized protein n=1 Tax=Morella rubra TaxID=262757 RepID=A0A6A1VIU3_9ROSI|nr:hypothetical protein CJ030_MR5G010119 [Morella rubra]
MTIISFNYMLLMLLILFGLSAIKLFMVHGTPTAVQRLAARLQQTTLQHLMAWRFHYPRFFCCLVPPAPASFKINVDVATRPTFSVAACLCRDDTGCIVHAEGRGSSSDFCRSNRW